MSLSAFRFLEIVSVIKTARFKEEKILFEQSAFTAWQITEFIKGSFSKKAKAVSFKDYLKNVGLQEEKPKTTKIERMREVERKIKKAERIRAKDKKREVK